MSHRTKLSIISILMGAVCCLAMPSSVLATRTVEIHSSDTTNVIEGSEISEQVGSYLNATGDFDGDGYNDLLIAANSSDRAGNLAGGMYLFYGTESGITSTSVNEADAFFHGGIESISPLDLAVGDLNNDGYSDLIFSGYVGIGKAKSYLFYGSSVQFSGEYAYDAADATFYSENDLEYIGSSLSMDGDVDNDGFDDLLIGDDSKDSSKGAAYLFYGSGSQFSGNVNITTADANWQGGDAGIELGTKVEIGGDINGDGFDDVLIGVRNQQVFGSDNGTLRLYYSSATRFTGSYTTNDSDAYFTDSSTNARMGDQFAVIGDINGDSIDDIVFKKSWINDQTGEVNIIYGNSQKFVGEYIPNETQDVQWTGSEVGDEFGSSIGGGDINGDGVTDLVTMAPGYEFGVAVVMYGSIAGQSLASGDMAELADVVLYSDTDVHGYYTAGPATDINGDGAAEIITSASSADGTFTTGGKVYITSIPLPQVVDLATQADNRVVLTFSNGKTRTIQCFPNGASKPKAKLSSNGEFVYCLKARGNELRVFSVRTGEQVANAPTFNKRHSLIRVKTSQFFVATNSDQLYLLGKRQGNVRLAYFSVNQDTGEITGKNRKLADDTAQKSDKYNLKINSAKKKANVFKNGEKIKSYLIKKGKLQ